MAVITLSTVLLGGSPAGAATVAVTVECAPWDGTFPIVDVTVDQGDTLQVSWDESCVHDDGDTVLSTDAALADAYFSSVPGQGNGLSSDSTYFALDYDGTSRDWVVSDDAPLGQMPLGAEFNRSYPYICDNCGSGVAIRLTVGPGASVPGAPEAPTATPGDGSAVLTWSRPADDGGSPITAYTATASPGGASCTATAPATTCTIDGLTNGEAYTFTVLATNAVGDGPPSAASAPVTPVAAEPAAAPVPPATAPSAALRGAPIAFAG